MTTTDLKDGRIVGIAGPVIDAEFPQGELPEINTALEFDVAVDDSSVTIVAGGSTDRRKSCSCNRHETN